MQNPEFLFNPVSTVDIVAAEIVTAILVHPAEHPPDGQHEYQIKDNNTIVINCQHVSLLTFDL